jgi:hypothetical protein
MAYVSYNQQMVGLPLRLIVQFPVLNTGKQVAPFVLRPI